MSYALNNTKQCIIAQELVRKTNKHKEVWRDTSIFGLQPCRGSVLFVPWSCPVCLADVLSHLCWFAQKSARDVPDVTGTRQVVPGTLLTHTNHEIPSVGQVARDKHTRITWHQESEAKQHPTRSCNGWPAIDHLKSVRPVRDLVFRYVWAFSLSPIRRSKHL